MVVCINRLSLCKRISFIQTKVKVITINFHQVKVCTFEFDLFNFESKPCNNPAANAAQNFKFHVRKINITVLLKGKLTVLTRFSHREGRDIQVSRSENQESRVESQGSRIKKSGVLEYS